MWCTKMLPALLMMLSSVASQDVSSYCGLCRPGSASGDQVNHTACLYVGIGADCTEATDGGVTEEEKALILKEHNRLRSLVASGKETRGLAGGPQPPAADMMALQWDEELSRIAQLWADQCKFQHDCRHVVDFKVGQNIAQYWNDYEPKIEWTDIIQGWYDEVGNWSAVDTASFRYTGLEVMTAHYTQVVWGNTRFVGCGRRAFKNGPFYVQHYVCNYGPAGNFWYLPLYAIGEPCTKCPDDSACTDGVLCEAGAGGKADSYAYRYSGRKSELDVDATVTTGPEDNDVNTDVNDRDKQLWEEWYHYLMAANYYL